jgi:urease accessory protein
MSTERDILTLTQWFSPAYPVGAFAYSHGLEAAVAMAAISSGDDVREWLTDVLLHGSGRNDCILLRAAFHADPTDLAMINDTAVAMAASSERQLEAKLQGAAFCQTTAAIWGGDETEYVYPVAVGAAAARMNLDVTLTASLFLHAMVSNLVAAAQRLIGLGQTEGQAIVSALASLCEKTAKNSATDTLDDLHSTAFLSDIAAMRHETLQPRIFRS